VAPEDAVDGSHALAPTAAGSGQDDRR
jgi:hypothetical protein